MSPQSAPEQPSSDQAQCDYYEPSHVTGSTFRAPVEWSADDLDDHSGLASISRVLSANDYHDRDGVQALREGTPDARNTVWWQPDPLAGTGR